MTSLLSRLRGAPAERSAGPGFANADDILAALQSYRMSGGSTVSVDDSSFVSRVQSMHREHGPIAAAVFARQLVLSQVRFAFRDVIRSSPNYRQLVGSAALAPLERPSPTLGRSRMLTVAEAHASYAGAAYIARHRDTGRLELLRPDLVDAVIDGPDDAHAVLEGQGDVISYAFWRRGRRGDVKPEMWDVADVAAWIPEPDPVAWWRGVAWPSALVRELATDNKSAQHVLTFFDKAATPNMIIKPAPQYTVEQIKDFQQLFAAEHVGTGNAGRTLWLAGGSDVQLVGSKLSELDLSNVQGGLETRIAVRSRVPAVVLGVRESLQGSALNSGNYGSARRLWADGWFTPTVQGLCEALTAIVPPPPGTELWYDPADVLFLQEDAKDSADIAAQQAQAIRTLVDGGYDPDAAVKAVRDGNLAALFGNHTGLVSVQLLPPGSGGSQ